MIHAMLRPGDQVALVACSNGLTSRTEVEQLVQVLEELGLKPVLSPCLYAVDGISSGSGRMRAQVLMDFVRDDRIRAIFDLSGGDIANEILPYLDYDLLRDKKKPLWGYSDVTTVLNAVYQRAGVPSCLYQLRTLVWENGAIQRERFAGAVFSGDEALFQVDWDFWQGSGMQGTLVGGNVRCLLKLAGTAYFPDLRGKLLFLEARGGGTSQIITYFAQLRQMGAFDQISGLLLGTFLQLEQQTAPEAAKELILSLVDRPELLIAKTQQVGHGNLSKCLVLGQEYRCGDAANYK